MAVKINIHEAKTHLSRILARVNEGEEFIIAKAGTPIARLTPVKKRNIMRSPGSARGKIKISPDFNAPLPDFILEEFEK